MDPPGVPRARRGACARHRAPRHQAREPLPVRASRRPGSTEGDRLRGCRVHRQGMAGRVRGSGGDRDPALHGARAAAEAAEDRHPERHLGPRGHALRAPRRRVPLRRRRSAQDGHAHSQRRAALAPAAARGAQPVPRRCHSALPRKDHAASLPRRGGARGGLVRPTGPRARTGSLPGPHGCSTTPAAMRRRSPFRRDRRAASWRACLLPSRPPIRSLRARTSPSRLRDRTASLALGSRACRSISASPRSRTRSRSISTETAGGT